MQQPAAALGPVDRSRIDARAGEGTSSAELCAQHGNTGRHSLCPRMPAFYGWEAVKGK